MIMSLVVIDLVIFLCLDFREFVILGLMTKNLVLVKRFEQLDMTTPPPPPPPDYKQ